MLCVIDMDDGKWLVCSYSLFLGAGGGVGEFDFDYG